MFMSRVVPVIALALIASAAHGQTQAPAQTSAGDEMVVGTPASAPPAATTDTAKPASASKPLTTDEQIKAWVTDAPKLDHVAPASDTDANAPRQIHGSAGVAVGSNGYSSAYVSSLIPIGKDSTLGVAVSQADYGGNTVDHGRIKLPRGRSQSLAVSLQLGNGQGTVPDGCPGFMDGGRYVEPVWVSRLHPDQSCLTGTDTETDTHSETTPGQ